MTFSSIRTGAVGTLSLFAVIVGAVATYVARADGQEAPAAAPPFSDYRGEKPGVMHRITVADLPKPFATEAANNAPKVVPRPEGAVPQALPGYTVKLYAEGLENPRLMRTAPNGDLFVAETGPGRIRVLRGHDGSGKPQEMEVFAAELNRPFGIAFYPSGPNPQFVYVANTDSIVRFPYQVGDLKARAAKETVVADAFPGGGHSTRDLVFSPDGKKMWVGVGSRSNLDDPDTTPAEKDRATVLEFAIDGSERRVYASGIRNASGLAINPATGQLWVCTNERDNLGDNLVPDYITHVEEGGFYIGRDPVLSTVVIHDKRISKRHVRIVPRDGNVWAIDEGSTNGTFLASAMGTRITEVQLKRGDTLILGDNAATFVYQI